MRFFPLLLLVGCMANKTKMTGVISTEEIYFDGWVEVKVTNAPSEPTMWVRLDKKQLEQAKKGTNVVFYVEAKEVHNEGW
tara:strand:- start:88 stop:327 length:240 start_codon:yes stop_codon:yes gene_type:complete